MNIQQHGLVDACQAIVASSILYERFCRLPACQNLNHSESMLLFSCFEEQRLAAGQVVYEANTPSDNTMRIIVDGTISGSSPFHEEVSLMHGSYIRLKAGDVFGLFSFLDEQRLHSATLKTESEVTLLAIDRSHFDLITLEDPKLGNQLLRFMFRLLSNMSLKLESEYAAMHHYVTGRRV